MIFLDTIPVSIQAHKSECDRISKINHDIDKIMRFLDD